MERVPGANAHTVSATSATLPTIGSASAAVHTEPIGRQWGRDSSRDPIAPPRRVLLAWRRMALVNSSSANSVPWGFRCGFTGP